MKKRVQKTIISVFTMVILTIVIIISNFVGLYPAEVHAAPISVNSVSDLFDGTNIKSGEFILNSDISLDNSVVVDTNTTTTIHLNSHIISFTDTIYGITVDGTLNFYGPGCIARVYVNDGIFTQEDGGTILQLTLNDCGSFTQKGGSINTVTVNDGGSFTQEGGTIIAVTVNDGGSFTQKDGRFVSVTVNDGGSFTQEGGSITNTARINSGGSFTQEGGSINNFIVESGGTFTQTGGTNPSNHTISLDAQGGTATSSFVTTVTTANGQCLAALPADPTPADTQHTFDGWYTDATGGDRVTTSTVFTSNSIIYARWADVPHPATPSVVYVSEPDPPVNYMQEVEDKITEAINLGGTQVVRIEGYPALSYHVLEMLQDNPDITLVSEFSYDGLEYWITIPGSAVELDPSIKWYGPKYLFPMFYMYGTDTLPAVQAYVDKYES